ncbi:hypothetical protein GCM10023149_51270 [Mucilaginibacter gynuensis]|uniref:Universal stress protein family protein n=1 Tax=Mucilaginibacter gynuensis TaxID=1302236 RepID=A0ABP8HJR7_9SPHI
MQVKKIIIPTDFRMESLDVIHSLVLNQPNDKFDIVLMHFFSLSDSITDLLMLSRRSREYQYVSEEFNDKCLELTAFYSDNISNIRVEFFYGNTVTLFKHFIEAHEIDAIVNLQGYTIAKLAKNSFDPATLISRCGLSVINLPLTEVDMAPQAIAETPATVQAELEEQEV